MTEVKNVVVHDLERCIVASGLAMRIEPYDYKQEILNPEKFKKHLERCKKLVRVSSNSDVKCHDNFLTGVRVNFDLKYPQYLSPELQRYHWIDIVTSMSKMHKLLKIDIDNCSNKYVTQDQIDNLNDCIEVYNYILENKSEAFEFHFRDYGKSTISGHKDCLYTAWMFVLSNCPLGLELWMNISTNYKQLQTIYHQRRNHKLKEDWGAITEMIEGLPYFNEFILGQEDPKCNAINEGTLPVL